MSDALLALPYTQTNGEYATCPAHVGAQFAGMTVSSLCMYAEGHEGMHFYAHPRRDIDSGRVMSMYGIEALRRWLAMNPEVFPHV